MLEVLQVSWAPTSRHEGWPDPVRRGGGYRGISHTLLAT